MHQYKNLFNFILRHKLFTDINQHVLKKYIFEEQKNISKLLKVKQ